VLDGDEIRARFSPALTYSKADRDLNVRRLGHLAMLLSRRGIIPIVAAISPYREIRDEIRRAHGASFVEVYVECPLPELIRRDPKGLYAKALRGDIGHFTGISDPYEPPLSSEISVHTDRETPGQSCRKILNGLECRDLITQRLARPAGVRAS